jgi:DNA-binding transcriptional regulator YhcF (GntR family)
MERIVKGIWIPIEIWEAQDLSWNEKILLMEIDSFTAEGKDCFISDEYVSTLLGVNMRNANKCMANLIHKGYVEKTRFDGRRRFVQSKICRADLSLKTEQTCLQRQHTYIESTYISPTEIINKGNRFDFKKALMEIGVTEQVAEDWLKVRKEAKASNTETAFKGILREIEKTGLSADECIRIAAENSWRGFKAEWIANQRKSTGKQSVLENNIAVAEELARLTKMI